MSQSAGRLAARREPVRVVFLARTQDEAARRARQLEQAGFVLEWSQAADPQAFLAALRLRPDLVVADPLLAGLSPEAALRLLRAENADTPFILHGNGQMATLAESGGSGLVFLCSADEELDVVIDVALGGPAALRPGGIGANLRDEILDLAMEGIVRQEADGRLTYVNRAAAEMLGYEPGELLDQHWSRITPEDQRPIVEEADGRRQRGESDRYKLELLRRDGSRVQVLVAGAPRIVGGRYFGSLAVFTDISGLERSQEALRHSNDMLRALIQASPVAITTLDQSGRVTLWNPAAERVFGWRADEVIGRPLPTVPPGSEEEHRGLRQRVLDGEWLDGVEVVRRRKDGRPIDIRLYTAPIRAPDGQTTGILGLMVDVTQARRAEASVAESEVKFRTLAEESPNIIFINRRGRVLYANKKATEVMGYERHEFALPEFDFLQLLAPESRPLAMENFRRHQAGEEVPPTAYTLLTRDGRRVEGLHSTRLIDYGGEPAILGIITDVTEARRAEAALARRAAQLEVLAEIGAQITAVASLEEVLRRTVALVHERLGYEHVGVFLRSPDGRDLVMQARAGTAAERIPEGHRLPAGKGLVGTAAASGQPVLVNNVADDPRYLNFYPDRIDSRSELSVPILTGGETVGVLDVQATSEAAFSEVDVQVLGILGDQLGAAISNAGLVGALTQSEQRYRDLTENSAVGIYRTTPEGDILVANPAVVRMLGFDSFDHLSRRNLETDGFEPDYPRAAFKERLERDGQIIGLESAWRRKDGTAIYVRESARVVRDDRGRSLYYEGTVEDITDRKLAEQALERHSLELQTLYESSLETIAHRDLEALLRAVVERATTLIGSNRGGLYLLDPGGQSLTLVVSHNYERDFTGAVLRLGEGVSGRVAESGQLMALNDYQKFDSKSPTFREIGTRRLLAIPLKVADQVIGVLNVADEEVGSFTEEEIHLVQLFADQAALAVENARLLAAERERTEELQRAHGLVEALSNMAVEAEHAQEPDEVMRVLGRQLKAMELQGWISLLDPESGDLVVRYGSIETKAISKVARLLGRPVYGFRIRRAATFVFEQVLGDRKPASVPLRDLLQAVAPELPKIIVGGLLRAVHMESDTPTLCLPLAVEERVLGCLFVAGRALQKGDLPAFSIFAGQIAGVIEKTRLLEETRRRATYLEGITSVSTALRAAATRAEMLPIILGQMRELLRVEGSAIERLDPDSGTVVTELAHGVWESWTDRAWPAGEGVRSVVLRGRRRLSTGDPATDPLFARDHGLVPQPAMACLPLIVQNEPIGLIWVGRRTPFSDGEERILTAVADLAANALHRAGVMETLEDRVRARTHQLEQANERLKELDVLKGKFVSNVSHELRTPITNIQLYLDLLRRPASDGRRDEYLTTLEGQSRRLGRLIEDLLALSRLDAGMVRLNLEAHLLDGLMTEVVGDQQARAEAKAIALVHEPHAECPPAWVSREQMMQVLTNLVANAVAYTPEGGRVVVETVCRRPAGREIAARVWNEGPPIPAEDRPRLFERFFRGQTGRDSGEPGTGLGLAICQEIIDRHSGRIEVESSAEAGTAFTVWLPAAGA